ncbi:MAG: CRISPR system precrRNA processing endoribonuclease RAMP protein Cas6 [Anaerolineae bacterium]|nr:CRISPR system precrRNA processing endoribonuclease RAMP protein Cas6 [Anaerolineae bacterium]
MLSFINQITLIRYLIVWKVNGSLVKVPSCLSAELSQNLGTIIANRLPTQEARAWRKALGITQEKRDPLLLPAPAPSSPWPIEVVLLPYPVKRIYGQGELIMWELKLLGIHADHNLFLELLLPAMEEASTLAHTPPKTLWGRFDIHNIYVAKGEKWEPLVTEGKLDLNYRPTPTQWIDGLSFLPKSGRAMHRIHWITPFELDDQQEPTLHSVLNALVARLVLFVPGKRPTVDDVWTWLPDEERTTLRTVLDDARECTPTRSALKAAPKGWPGRRIGSQLYTTIPHHMVPYLQLASILHVGKHTHFGCGTFKLE